MVFFVASAMALLMTTNFLQLRRYLRQKRLPMPAPMAGMWLAWGIPLLIGLLLFSMFLPRPHPEYSISQLDAFSLSEESRRSSRVHVGREDTEDKDRQGNVSTNNWSDHRRVNPGKLRQPMRKPRLQATTRLLTASPMGTPPMGTPERKARRGNHRRGRQNRRANPEIPIPVKTNEIHPKEAANHRMRKMAMPTAKVRSVMRQTPVSKTNVNRTGRKTPNRKTPVRHPKQRNKISERITARHSQRIGHCQNLHLAFR